MRFRYVLTVLGIGSFALLLLAPEGAQAWGRRFYGGPVYYQPCLPMYYAPPMYYQPMAYSGPPMYYQPSYAPGYSPARPTMVIGAYDDYFQPGTLNVQPGTTVRFVNYGRHTHTVTSKDGRWDSGDLPPGYSYSVTFVTPGTHYYYCRHHTKEKMQGTIVVGRGGYGPSGGYSGSGSSGY